jgi:hypothetical protein
VISLDPFFRMEKSEIEKSLDWLNSFDSPSLLGIITAESDQRPTFVMNRNKWAQTLSQLGSVVTVHQNPIYTLFLICK